MISSSTVLTLVYANACLQDHNCANLKHFRNLLSKQVTCSSCNVSPQHCLWLQHLAPNVGHYDYAAKEHLKLVWSEWQWTGQGQGQG